MTVFILEIVAMVTMLIDHVQHVFKVFGANIALLGRITFPVYAFLVVNGYYHVRGDSDRLRRYLIRLLILGLISEIPHDLAFYSVPVDFTMQNQVLQYFIAMIALVSHKEDEPALGLDAEPSS